MAISPEVKRLHDWLQAHEADLLADFQAILRFPSIEGPAAPSAPFGPENREVLDFVLTRGKGWDMTTRDVGGYCGWAEFGSGKDMIAILGHLDVVPVGPGWKYDPFSATIDGDYVYSRGAIDDKGPTIAAFYAAKAVMDCFPNLDVRIRTVFGCNEESGFKCIERYAETEELPTYGFAPDAGWPLYHAEKGIANLRVKTKRFTGGVEVVSLEGGQRTNIVIDSAKGTLRVSAEARKEVEEKLAKNWDANLITTWDGDLLHFEARGKAAHGSWPHGGDNAATRILRAWMEIAPTDQVRAFEDLFETAQISGMGLGIHGSDAISQLTSNLGIVRTDGDHLVLTHNIRYPVTWKGEDVLARCEAFLPELEGEYSVEMIENSTPLYFPLEHPLVSTVLEVYEAETGEKRKPGVMGGGTYARAIPNCVAIGTGWAGDGDAHQTDERLKIAHLYKMSRIYAHILYRLASRLSSTLS